MEYHQPDERWAIFGANNYEEYLSKYLVKGKFNAKVPLDVVNAYETIEYLQVHAYYYWPMYDEALSKLLRTIEMAAKHRCTELGIAIEVKNSKGKINPKMLNSLILDLIKAEPEKNQKNILEFAKTLRNIFMHPNQNSFGGGMIRHNFFHFINAINVMFADEKAVKNILEQTIVYRKLVEPFANKTLSYETNQGICYLHNIRLLETYINKGTIIHLLMLEPIIEVVPNLTKKYQFCSPILLEVVGLLIDHNEMTANLLNENENVKLNFCHAPEIIVFERAYEENLDRVKDDFQTEYGYQMDNAARDAARDFKYKYYNLL